MSLRDVDANYPALFVVEDNVALTSGHITDRDKDWLSQSDKGVILFAPPVGGGNCEPWPRASPSSNGAAHPSAWGLRSAKSLKWPRSEPPSLTEKRV